MDFHSAIQGFTQWHPFKLLIFGLSCSQIKRPLTFLSVRTEVRMAPGQLRATGRNLVPPDPSDSVSQPCAGVPGWEGAQTGP